MATGDLYMSCGDTSLLEWVLGCGVMRQQLEGMVGEGSGRGARESGGGEVAAAGPQEIGSK